MAMMPRSRRKTLAAVVAIVLAGGCASGPKPAPEDRPLPPALLPPAAPEAAPEYRISVGDEFDVKFPFHSDMNQSGVIVRPDGRVSLEATGELTVVGLTPAELQDAIAHQAGTRLRDPEVVVVLRKLQEQRVYVGGEVGKPGFVPLRPDMTPLQAIMVAGWFRATAKREHVLLLTPLAGGKMAAARIDMDQVVEEGVVERVRLHPNDIIVVPPTWVANADIWVDQWVRGLIPVLPRVGVGYNPGSGN